MSHLEDLIAEYYDWQGYLVKRNIKVGRLKHGGWEMELDVLAYHPHTNHLIHVEPSLDSNTWARREERFSKKFKAAKKYIYTDIFTWIDKSTPLEQIAVLPTHSKDRDSVGGGKIISVDDQIAQIRTKVMANGLVRKNAIPEFYPLLRTMQLSHVGYSSRVDS